jgi:hypothetical protein
VIDHRTELSSENLGVERAAEQVFARFAGLEDGLHGIGSFPIAVAMVARLAATDPGVDLVEVEAAEPPDLMAGDVLPGHPFVDSVGLYAQVIGNLGDT